jgi:hypothetical protein
MEDSTTVKKSISIENDPLQYSLIRLPFQVFLASDENGKEVAQAIVMDQVTTETLQDWVTISIQLPRLLPFKRVFLESSSVCADLRRCLERRMVCDEKLILRVSGILSFNPNMISIIRHVSSELSKVVQSEHKVKVFGQLTSLLDERLKQSNFSSKTEFEHAQLMLKSLVNGRNAFFVLSQLSKYSLLDSKTLQLSGRVMELCKHILNRITNWSDFDSISELKTIL